MYQSVLKYRNGQATILALRSPRTPEGAPYANWLEPAKHGIGLTLPPWVKARLEFDMLLKHIVGLSCPVSLAVLLGSAQSFNPARSLRIERPP